MTTTLTPMTETELHDWFVSSKAEYLDDLLRAGESRDQAQVSVDQSFERYFPAGVPTDNHLVFTVLTSGIPAGYLWIGPHTAEQSSAWWVWDIAINADHRGQGLGRAAMLLAEDAVRERGGTTLGLNVFGFNAPARGLYESLGYEITSMRMLKKLTP